MVDELLSAYPHQLSFSEAGLRIMITSHFPPKTRLSMASRMLINEVCLLSPPLPALLLLNLHFPVAVFSLKCNSDVSSGSLIALSQILSFWYWLHWMSLAFCAHGDFSRGCYVDVTCSCCSQEVPSAEICLLIWYYPETLLSVSLCGLGVLLESILLELTL